MVDNKRQPGLLLPGGQHLARLDMIPTARLLLDTFRAFENHLVRVLRSHGFDNVTPGNFNVLRHVNPEGMRLVELARDAQISKQAIGKMVSELERKGYLALHDDDTDRRAKKVCFTRKGERLIALAVDAISEMEKSYGVLLGDEGVEHLRDGLTKIQQWHDSKE